MEKNTTMTDICGHYNIITQKDNDSMLKSDNDLLVTQEATSILIKIIRFGRKHGMNTLLKKLEQGDLEGSNNQLISNCIFEKVEKRYEITRNDLTGTKRGAILDARNMCILLLYSHLSISTSAVMKYFNRNKSGFFKIRNEFDDMRKNPISPEEKSFVSIYNSINEDVIKFKEDLKKNKK